MRKQIQNFWNWKNLRNLLRINLKVCWENWMRSRWRKQSNFSSSSKDYFQFLKSNKLQSLDSSNRESFIAQISKCESKINYFQVKCNKIQKENQLKERLIKSYETKQVYYKYNINLKFICKRLKMKLGPCWMRSLEKGMKVWLSSFWYYWIKP